MTTQTKLLLSTTTAAVALVLLWGAPARHREAGERFQVSAEATESFIVQHEDMESAKSAVELVGGTVTHELSIIHAVGARLTLAQLGELRRIRGLRVTRIEVSTFRSIDRRRGDVAARGR